MAEEHPVRVGPMAYMRIKKLALAEGIPVKDAADRLVRGACAKLSPDAEDAVKSEMERLDVSYPEAVDSMVMRAHRRLRALERYAVTSCSHDECGGKKLCIRKQAELYDPKRDDKREEDF